MHEKSASVEAPGDIMADHLFEIFIYNGNKSCRIRSRSNPNIVLIFTHVQSHCQ